MARLRSARYVLTTLSCVLLSVLGWVAGTASASAGSPGTSAGAITTPIYLDTGYSFAERAADLVSRMTLAEKVQQMHTNNAPAIPRLGVEQYTYWSEGQHGLNRLGADAGEGGQGAVDDVRATSFPVNFASTMSWDPNLIYDETTAISDEARGFLDKSLFNTGQNNIGPDVKDYGDLTFWAPTVNLDRDPRWGRTDEAFGEDPYLDGQMAGAFVNGYQGNNMAGRPTNKYLKVAATAKHYALNNVENNRLTGDSVTTEADLHQYYLKQFQTLIENDHVAGLMTSYNAINGTPGAVNTYTVNQQAQRTFGFGGYITSDCDAIDTAWDNHNWAAPGWTSSVVNGQKIWTKNNDPSTTIPAAAGGLAYALRAGTQLECTGDSATLPNVQAAIDAGILSVGVIDTDLTKLFTMRMSTGEFDPPTNNPYTKITKSVIESPAHQQLARKVADNDIVLLQNNAPNSGGSRLLPVDPSKLNNVVILGDLANTVTLGDYSGRPDHTASAVQGITNAVKAANPNATITFDAAGTSSTATSPATLSDATKAAIQNADLIVLVAGTTLNNASEGRDRSSLAMPGNYDSLINQVAALGNPNMALDLQANGPVDIEDVRSEVPSIVFSGYNGQDQGDALADALFGKQNPDGHLDFTWYKDDSQLPNIQNYGLDAASTGGLGRTYQYFTGAPTYPFGYGLSYSKFQISDVTASTTQTNADGFVGIGLTVTNTGRRAGTTVPQVYVSSPGAGQGDVPLRRLAAFGKTNVLQPGQSQHLNLKITIADLALWDTAHSKNVVTDGTYTFNVGTDAATVVASKNVQVTGSLTPHVQYVTVQPPAVDYQAGQSFDLNSTNKWLADDTNTAEEPDRNMNLVADKVVEAVDNNQSFVDLSTAHVKYSSSDPSVASVDANGVVHAIKDGVATITVNVDGVSGSTPIVVQGTITDSVPQILAAASSGTASATFTNGDARPVSKLTLGITVPDGWTATANTPTSFASVPANSAVTAKWTISPAAGADPGTYPVTFTATSSAGTVTAADQVKVPYASLAAAYDNTGISTDGSPATKFFDGASASYSAQALTAVGLNPGTTATVAGIDYQLGDADAPDNVLANGQVLPVGGQGNLLGFLGASAYGSTSGTGTIVYADGSTQPYSLNFADWWSGSASPGSSIAATLPYINSGANSSRQNQTVHLYQAWVSVDPNKTVQYVLLPQISDTQTNQQAAMHIFGIGLASDTGNTAVVGDSLGNPDNASGVGVREEGDGHTTATSAAGLPARTTTGPGSLYMYYDIDDSIVPGGQYDATAYVTYYDHGTGTWDIQYDSYANVNNPAFRDSQRVTDTNTDIWKTAQIPLPEANFRNRENGGTDFRLNIGVGQQDIARIAVSVTGAGVVPVHLVSTQPTPPTVTTQPEDATAAAGSQTTFTAHATGDPAPVVQWQSSTSGGPWTDIADAASATLTVSKVTAADDGTQYRAQFRNVADSTTSDPATLHVQ
jgi:beta-glucosidase-like glycosyl hydrolase